MNKRKFNFYVFNIKLQTNKQNGERTSAYEALIKSLTGKKRFTRLSKSDAITMYPPFEREDKGLKYFYGNIGKGISFFDKDEVKVLNNNSVSSEPMNKESIFEPVMGEYIFIPSIHRIGLIKRPNSISVNEFELFLKEHLPSLVGADEKIEISYEKEPSIIDEIFEASAVFSLSYEITYTNNDALSAQGELFDELLKDNNIGKLSLNASSDHNGEGMNINDVNFLAGGLEVARNNGVIRSATIKPNPKSKIIKVTNKEKPLIQEVELVNEEDDLNFHWFKKFLRLYK